MSWLIGIGGRGQAVVSSYLRLCILCGIEPVRIAIIDADQRGEAIRNIVDLSARWCQHKILQVNAYPKLPDEATEGYKFSNLIEADSSQGYAELLFREGPESLSIPIKVGMRGNPSVGSSVFLKKILENDQDTKDENLRELFNGIQNQRVALVGSTFGGTGSGGLPKFAEFLKKKGASDLAAVSFLPYFRLKAEAADQYVDSTNKKIAENPAGNVYYFKDEMRKWVNRIILFGLPDNVERSSIPSDGIKEQKEIHHFLHLLAALELNDYLMTGPNPDEQEREGRLEGKIYGYWYKWGEKEEKDNGVGISGLTLVKSHGRGSASVPLKREIGVGGDVLLLLAQFINYLTPLPREGFFPNMTVPGWLRVLLQQLDAAEVRAVDELKNHLVVMYNDMRACVDWLFGIGEKPNNNGIFIVSRNRADSNYPLSGKIMHRPMRIFHKWMDGKEDEIKRNLSPKNKRWDEMGRKMVSFLREEVVRHGPV